MQNRNLRSVFSVVRPGHAVCEPDLQTKWNVAERGELLMEHFSRIRPTASLLVMLTAVLLLAQSSLFGQATGNVTGVVADTTGAVIPKAAVTLTDALTGL